MADEIKGINFDVGNLAYLEQVDDVSMPIPEIDAIKEAAARGIDLSALEALDEMPAVQARKITEGVPLIVNQNAPDADSLKNEWGAFSLAMGDAVPKIFELSDRPFFIIRDDKIAYINKTAMAILEISNAADVIGMSFWQFVVKEDWNLLSQNIGAMLTDGMIVSASLLEHRNERGKQAENIINNIISEQKIDVDAISGATNSSNVIKKAIENAIKTFDNF